MVNIDWCFNLKVFIDSYRALGYETEPEDWNPRFYPGGEIRLDNTYTKCSTSFVINDGILTVEVRPWNVEINDGRSSNIDIFQTRGGWRDSELFPDTSPPHEGVAFLNHLEVMGYYPVRIPDEDQDIPCY